MSESAAKTRPIAVGSRLTVTVQDIAFGGEGVARADDFVLFVPFVLVGEQIEVEVTEVKKSFGRAKLVRVLEASPDRVEAPCPYFGRCGGCQYQHIDYPAQLRIKHKQIADLFQRIGGFSHALVDPVIPCPSPYGYRNRIMVRSQWNKPEQRLNIGFLRHDCNLVEDIKECLIAEPALNEQLKEVWKHPPHKGGIKVVIRLHPEGWQVPKDSFFQNNFKLLPKLVEAVGDRLRDSGARHLIDTYCGVGFFGIELAGLVESFVGVEIDRPAILAARHNAATRNVTNGEFIEGKTEDHLPDLLRRFSADKTSVLIDPPRTGCRPESLNLLLDSRPAQILYVSCHPATLARDLNILVRDGVYELKKVVPLDMFPQTQHVECVADLRLKSPC